MLIKKHSEHTFSTLATVLHMFPCITNVLQPWWSFHGVCSPSPPFEGLTPIWRSPHFPCSLTPQSKALSPQCLIQRVQFYECGSSIGNPSPQLSARLDHNTAQCGDGVAIELSSTCVWTLGLQRRPCSGRGWRRSAVWRVWGCNSSNDQGRLVNGDGNQLQ